MLIASVPIDYDNLITTGGIIIVAVVGAFGVIQTARINTAVKHIKVVREQTENNHADTPEKIPNLRDNIDSNQYALIEKLDGIIDTQRRQGNKIDKLFSVTTGHTEQLNEMKNKEK